MFSPIFAIWSASIRWTPGGSAAGSVSHFLRPMTIAWMNAHMRPIEEREPFRTLERSFGDVLLTVPWRDLGLVLVVAVGAGLVASVLPGRTAARTSPVAALAVD